MAKLMEGVNPNTVWTWNAIGKRSGTWNLAANAGEATRGFLLNHLIRDLLPPREGGYRYANADPVTGQAAWYDLRVRIEKAHRQAPAQRARIRNARRAAAAATSRNPALWRAIPPNGKKPMTSLPEHRSDKRLGLVIDLDVCVGCHACAVNCKEWNSGGVAAPLTDLRPYDEDPLGVWFNRIHSYETSGDDGQGRTVHFPRSCLHCDEPACVTVCPTGASYKRAEDGIVLVNEDLCIGCKLCSWACPYGAREYDYDAGVMKKCTLCIDRIYNENLAAEERVPACVATCPTSARHFGDLGDPNSDVSKLVRERGGYDLMPEMGYKPVNRYLPPRPRRTEAAALGAVAQLQPLPTDTAGGLLGWIDRLLSN